MYLDDTPARAKIMSPMSVRIDVWGATVKEAMTLGECVRLLSSKTRVRDHLLTSKFHSPIAESWILPRQGFRASVYRIRTAEFLTMAQAKAFTLIMERAYLSTHPKFRTYPPGGPYIIDESDGSTLLKAEPTEINIDPLAPVDEVQGMLQYLPMGGAFQAVRAIMIPLALGQSQIDPLDMPQ